MRELPKPQELYRHFKGGLYQVLTLARDAGTDRKQVIYQALYGDYQVWSRPLDEFLSEVDREKYPDAREKYRFTKETVPKATGGTEDTDRSLFRMPVEPPLSRVEPEVRRSIPAVTGVMARTIEEEAAELHMDPLVVAFLDADNASDRIQILEELRGRVTNDMIDIMAMAAGVEVDEGEPWDRFGELRDCLRTIEKFETTRLRG
ncbi:MAG: DUF1653 domain-containing protein [Lachnospiraceae bacterium]|nr:DUF1653 domain-containing protein [Lachnospiraceae bacterium]